MVLFHISPLLPLLTDFLNAIQQAREQSKQPCGLPCSTDKSSPVYTGRQTDAAPVAASADIPAVLPRLSSPSASRKRTLDQVCPIHGMPMGSKEIHDLLQSCLKTWRKGLSS